MCVRMYVCVYMEKERRSSKQRHQNPLIIVHETGCQRCSDYPFIHPSVLPSFLPSIHLFMQWFVVLR